LKFKGLDSRVRGVAIERFKWNGSANSIGEEQLGLILRELFPTCGIFHEFPCVGTRLRLDFFIPIMSLAFEFDGRQHEEHVPHFHGDRIGYAKSQTNDADKQRWCELNGIKLIRITCEDLVDGSTENVRSKIDEAS